MGVSSRVKILLFLVVTVSLLLFVSSPVLGAKHLFTSQSWASGGYCTGSSIDDTSQSSRANCENYCKNYNTGGTEICCEYHVGTCDIYSGSGVSCCDSGQINIFYCKSEGSSCNTGDDCCDGNYCVDGTCWGSGIIVTLQGHQCSDGSASWQNDGVIARANSAPRLGFFGCRDNDIVKNSGAYYHNPSGYDWSECDRYIGSSGYQRSGVWLDNFCWENGLCYNSVGGFYDDSCEDCGAGAPCDKSTSDGGYDSGYGTCPSNSGDVDVVCAAAPSCKGFMGPCNSGSECCAPYDCVDSICVECVGSYNEKCSPNGNTAPYNNWGMCTVDSGCVSEMAALYIDSSDIYFSSCTVSSAQDNGDPCDYNSLAGGFSRNGYCWKDNCCADSAECQRNSDCASNNCQSDCTCAAPSCTATGGACSVHGDCCAGNVCAGGFCDNDEVCEGISGPPYDLWSDCDSFGCSNGDPCDSDASDGLSLNKVCSGFDCVAPPSCVATGDTGCDYGGDCCTAGDECVAGTCMDCGDASEGTQCSDDDSRTFSNDGICVDGSCDEWGAIKLGSNYINSGCTSSYDNYDCDTDSLAGGFDSKGCICCDGAPETPLNPSTNYVCCGGSVYEDTCPSCTVTGDEDTAAQCSDGNDNDCDGKKDCDDSDCASHCCASTGDSCNVGSDCCTGICYGQTFGRCADSCDVLAMAWPCEPTTSSLGYMNYGTCTVDGSHNYACDTHEGALSSMSPTGMIIANDCAASLAAPAMKYFCDGGSLAGGYISNGVCCGSDCIPFGSVGAGDSCCWDDECASGNCDGGVCVGGCTWTGSEDTDAACDDGVDNDCDGDVDCSDSGCTGTTPCPASCSPGGPTQSCTPSNPANTNTCTQSRTCNTATGNWNGWGSCTCTCVSGYSWDGDSCEPDCTATETACGDGFDNDCDGSTDCGDSDCYGVGSCVCSYPNDCGGFPACNARTTYYRDQDGDGYGTNSDTLLRCSPPAGYVAQGGDCMDTGTNSNLCTTSCVTVYRDADGDSYGNPGVTSYACQGFGGYVGNNNDCDDADDDLWNQCCAGADIEIFEIQYSPFFPTTNEYDFAFHDASYGVNPWEDTTDAGCFWDTRACYHPSLSTSGQVTAVDTTQTVGGYTYYCSGDYCDIEDSHGGCAWQDCDASQTICETECGFNWLVPASNQLPFGGYNGPGGARTECCGDEPNEVLSVGYCPSSADRSTICCDSSGLWNLNGECVARVDCPDAMRGAPVWVVPASSAMFDIVLAATDGSDSFCCEFGEAIYSGGDANSYDSYCQFGDDGCYTTLASVEVEPPTPPFGKAFCPTNDNCVLDLCSAEEPFSICETSTECQEYSTPLTLEVMTDLHTCTYSSHEEEVYCYPAVDPSATTLEPACEVVVEEVCEVSGDIEDVCDVVCEYDGGVATDCSFACSPSDMICTTHTTYRNCDAPATGGDVCTTKTKNIQVSGCDADPLAIQTEFGIAPWACPMDGSTSSPTCPFPNYVVETSTCIEKTYCTEVPCSPPGDTSAHNLRCMNPTSDKGFDQYIAGGSATSEARLVCSPDGDNDPVWGVLDGDYWCPEGFAYNPLRNRCERPTNQCDYGFTGNLQFSCDTLTPESAADRDYWGLYDDDCVDSTAASPGSEVYDRACCLDFVLSSALGDYEIYQDRELEDYIKVY